jgi:hypothetical protein
MADNAPFDTFVPLVSFVYFQSTIKKKHKPFRGSSNKHSYLNWFQLAQWFQRRILKTDNILFATFGSSFFCVLWIYGRFFIKIGHFVLIHEQTWPP